MYLPSSWKFPLPTFVKGKKRNKEIHRCTHCILKNLQKTASNLFNLWLQMNNSPHCMEIASNLFWAEMEFRISEK